MGPAPGPGPGDWPGVPLPAVPDAPAPDPGGAAGGGDSPRGLAEFGYPLLISSIGPDAYTTENRNSIIKAIHTTETKINETIDPSIARKINF